MKNSAHLAIALLAGGSMLAIAAVASAQTAPAPAPAAPSEVVVTGSRVITNGNNSPTAVTVVPTAQLLQVQPTTLSDMVNTLPQLEGSQTQAVSGSGIRNGAAAYLTLRNAGDNHTLVLWDGNRMQPTTSQESHASDVDINVIPQMLIQRVDVVTGGVSAVYGSDAVTGVVNFVTDTHFNGLKLNASAGESTYGDDSEYDIGIAAGRNFLGGRAHVEFSYENRNDPGIFNHTSRPIYAADNGYAGNGTTIPYYLTPNLKTSSQSFNGLISSGPLSGLEANQTNGLSPFVNGTATGVANQQIGGDGAWNNLTSLKASLNFNQFFLRGDYDVTDKIHAFVQFADTTDTSRNVYTQNQISSLKIGYNNAYLAGLTLPPGYTNPYSATNTTSSMNFSRTLNMVPQNISDYTKYYMAIGGLDGTIGDYKWSVSAEHSESSVYVRNSGNINNGRLDAAMNSVVSGGQPVCAASLTNAAYAGCVPINLFGPGSVSPAAIAYITDGGTGSNSQSLFNTVNASISGAPISTWAGPVQMAVSGNWRSLTYHLLSFDTPADLANCAGIQFNCTQGTTLAWTGNTLSDRSSVNQTVGEIAYETDIPLAKNLPFMQAFNLNGAARFTNYNTSGNYWTWKIGVDWHVDDQWTIRATRSRDIRAPNLNDLFNPPQPNHGNFSDILTGLQNQPSVAVTVANPNLVPEEADTTTAGVVWRPSFIPRFSLSVDAYNILVRNAIIGINGTSSQVQQICNASGGTSSLCSLIVRPLPFSNTTAANFPTEFLNEAENIAGMWTYGADFEANYAATVADRPLTLRALFSWQPHLLYNLGPAGFQDLGDTVTGSAAYGTATSSPSLRLTAIGQYNFTEDFSVTLMERWRNGMIYNANRSLLYVNPNVPSIEYTNVTLDYNWKSPVGPTDLYLNVQNLFNAYVGGNNPLPFGDDVVGRYFTVGFRFRH